MPKKTVKPLLLIAGPCVLETEKEALLIGKKIQAAIEGFGWEFVFKASYDKANRSSVTSARGPGIERGLDMLASIGQKLGVRTTTDVHNEKQAALAGEKIDILQIPAFLSRQTDLLLAAAATGKAVNVKKGQFLAPADADLIAAKLKSGGCRQYWITERGTSFGYNNLIVDMRSLAWMKKAGHPVIFDSTHSVQRPAGQGSTTGGDGALAPVLARAALATACLDGIFIETHPRPERSPSDGPNMIPLALMPRVLKELKIIHHAVSTI